MTHLKISGALCNKWGHFYYVSANPTPKYDLHKKGNLVAHVTDKAKDCWLQAWLDPGTLNNALFSAFLL